MNTSSNTRRCPRCSAEIPAGAPQGLCPKCLLLQVASSLESAADSWSSQQLAAGGTHAGKSGQDRPEPPLIRDLAAAFPSLEILELIGRGGMGFVYKARQTKLDRLVALKILPGHLANEPAFHERFEREARVLAKLQHPHIVAVYDFGEAVLPQKSTERVESSGADVSESASDEASYFYLMLEFIDGVNLREAMRAGRFSPEQALVIVPQVCEALQFAHSKGVLHRDIKPENILLAVDGCVKIADFGIAKVLGPGFATGHGSDSRVGVTRLTATGSILGTPLYMAPEQLMNPNSVDHRADIFSLGVVFYEMLTGELPMGRFAAPSEKALVDQRIDEVVMRALAREKELRQQSAIQMKTEVESIASTPGQGPAKTTAHRQVVPPPPPNNRVGEPSTLNPDSGIGGWLALAALLLGIPFAMSPFVAFTVRTQGPPVHHNVAILPLLIMILVAGSGAFGPIWLGWRHLIRQYNSRGRNGVIPAAIAAWFLPLFIADVLIFFGVIVPLEQFERGSATSHEVLRLIANYVAGLLCLIVDGAVLFATWKWATRTRWNWHGATGDSDLTARRIWGLGLIVVSILLVVGWGSYVALENRRVTNQWFQDITSSQHEWQTATNTLNMLDMQWNQRKRQLERTPDQAKQLDAEFKAYTDKQTRLRNDVAQLEGRMKVLSTMGNYRDGIVTFMPVALFAIPLAATGVFLLVRRRRMLLFAIGVVVSVSFILFFLSAFQAERGASIVTFDDGPKVYPPIPSDVPLKSAVSAARAEAQRLQLIQIADVVLPPQSRQQAIVLKGESGEVTIEPHFSALVRLPKPTNRLSYKAADGPGTPHEGNITTAYPCDYIACDWSEADQPHIIGYLTSPGGYDFRGDPDTTEAVAGLKSSVRGQIASRCLKLINEGTSSEAVDETAWQQATQQPHLRFKLVSNLISKLSVPDECLIILADGAHTALSRNQGRFIQHTLRSDQQVRELRELIGLKLTGEKVENDPKAVAEPERDQPADATTPDASAKPSEP